MFCRHNTPQYIINDIHLCNCLLNIAVARKIVMWTGRELNPRPLPCQGSDLPLIYQPREYHVIQHIIYHKPIAADLYELLSFKKSNMQNLISSETLKYLCAYLECRVMKGSREAQAMWARSLARWSARLITVRP